MFSKIILTVLPLYASQSSATHDARTILESIALQREGMLSGQIEVHQALRMPDGEAFCLSRIKFDGDRCRVDVLDSTEAQHLGEILRGEPVKESWVWTGKSVLRRAYEPTSFPFTQLSPNQASIYFFFPRVLGFPGRSDNRMDARLCLRADWLVESVSHEREAESTIVLASPRSSERITFTVDRNKAWGVTGWSRVRKSETGVTFSCQGRSELEQWGGHWYPRRYVYEQSRDGVWEWSMEYTVVRAEFNNVSIHPDVFGWQGLGIREGMPILSYEEGVRSYSWTAKPQEVLKRLNESSEK